MMRTQARLVLLFLVVAFAMLTTTGTASAGWTWTGVQWADDEQGAVVQDGWTWDATPDAATSDSP